MSDQPLISVVLSFRNEEAVIPELVSRLSAVFTSLDMRYELLFVNDRSSDRSLEILTDLHRENPSVKAITMSRRFGVFECIMAGFEHARGDAVVVMDSDLQDPPEVIKEMVEKWQEGADVVYTVRTSRAGESAFKLFVTKIAYRVIRAISKIDMPVDAGDFKLVSRRAMNEVLKLRNEAEPYTRGIVSWVGFNQVPVYYDRAERGGGQGQFPLFRSLGPINTLLNGLTSFSVIPLQIFLLLGSIVTALTLLALIPIFWSLCFGVPLSAAGLLLWCLFLLTGIQLMGIGIVGVYVGRVFDQVRGRPNYIIDSTVGLD